jgi:DDE superfamily endonuclease
MLQHEMLPASFAGLLWMFRSCFTAPSFRTFCALMAGMIAQPGRRTVCGMLSGAGLAGVWHHGRAHWFFASARWCADAAGLVLVRLITARLCDADAPVLVAVDDTLFRRSGRKVHAAAWQHDGARKGPKKDQVSFGNCWVIAGIIVALPFVDRPVCLPVLARLSIPKKGATKQVIACTMITLIAGVCPGRGVHVVADAWYAGMDGACGAASGATRGRGLPAGVTLTSRLRANAALYQIATPVPGAGGRPRRIGERIGTPKHLAVTAAWVPARVRRYGHNATVAIAEHVCLWYGVYRSRAVRVVLLRGQAAKNAYQLALITTDLHTPATAIIERYAARWSIEVAIQDAKQITGVGQARNRTPAAVSRTVPFALISQSLVVIWYTQAGHHPDVITARRRAAPWYRTKTQPAYQDMLIKLRRVLIAARYLPPDLDGQPRQPTPQQTLAVHQAWTEAAA